MHPIVTELPDRISEEFLWVVLFSNWVLAANKMSSRHAAF